MMTIKNMLVAAFAAFAVVNASAATATSTFFEKEAVNAEATSFAELVVATPTPTEEAEPNYVEAVPETEEAIDSVTLVELAKSTWEHEDRITSKSFNRDYRTGLLLNEDSVVIGEVALESAPNNGVVLGAKVGADYFNGDITPTVGGELGYHGRNFMAIAGAEFGISKYNSESDKAGKKYLMTNFSLDLGVRVCDFKEGKNNYLHQNELWLVGQFGYKVRKNHNAFSSSSETETETTTTNLTTHVKGSTMTFGGGFKLVFKNYMKSSNIYVKAIAYCGQEYFVTGSERKFGASVSVGINFVAGKHHYNTKAINALFGGKPAYKQALKTKQLLANY